MHTLNALAFVIVMLGASSSALAVPTPTTGPSPIQCEIDMVTTPRGLVLRPVARSEASISGSYQLIVETSAVDGRSTVTQGGDFALLAGQSQALGMISLGHTPRATMAARLEIDWEGGHTGCSRRATLTASRS
jgi:hypothetical protein